MTTFGEQLTIDGSDLVVAGCCVIRDLSPLLAGSDLRGSSRLVPHLEGRVPLPHRVDETVVNLDVLILGEVTFAGVAHPSRRVGLLRNVKQLAALTAPVPTAPFTRSAVLGWHGESIAAKPVQRLGGLSTAADKSDAVRVVLRLGFPDGLFEL